MNSVIINWDLLYPSHYASFMEDENINIILPLHSNWRCRHVYFSQDIHNTMKNVKIKLLNVRKPCNSSWSNPGSWCGLHFKNKIGRAGIIINIYLVSAVWEIFFSVVCMPLWSTGTVILILQRSWFRCKESMCSGCMKEGMVSCW